MTTMKRTVSWITALAMILMLCTCTVIAQASDPVKGMYSDLDEFPTDYGAAARTFEREPQNASLSSPYTGNWYLINTSVNSFNPDELPVSLEGKSVLQKVGTSYHLKNTVNAAATQYAPYQFTVARNNTMLRMVLPAGLPAGNYVLYNTNGGGSTWTFTVYERFNSTVINVATGTDISVSSGSAPSFTVNYGDSTLVQGTDYTVTYAVDTTVANNTAVYSGSGVPTVPGSYVATINASGLFRDDGNGVPITVKFDILPKDISTAIDVNVAVMYYNDTYTGSAIFPEVSVYDGQTRLIKGVDYTLDYDNNVEVGNSASVTVTGMGKYTGAKTLYFSIVKASTVVYQSSPTYVTAVAAPSNPTLKSGDKNNDVSTLQTRLNELGYNCGEVDGVFGAKTRAAVIAFQKANNLSVDGVAGPQTWAALGAGSYVYYTPVTVVSTPVAATASTASHSTLSRGKTGDEVKELQTLLNKMGYDCGLVDGVFGAKTEAAVRAFQAATNLAVDGIVGPLTWNKIDD